jgi:hypothetical protein
MEFSRELETLQRELPALLQSHRGEFVLIQGDTVAGCWPSEEEAYTAGCATYGLRPFLVMPVVEHEEALPVYYQLNPRCRL